MIGGRNSTPEHKHEPVWPRMSHSRVARRLATAADTYFVNTPLILVPAQVELGPRHRVLDLGSEGGCVAGALTRRIGLVHRPVGIVQAGDAAFAARHDWANERTVTLVQAGLTDLPFAEGSFHLVLAPHVFHRLDDQELYRLLIEAHRVLVPGGILLVWDFAPTSSQRLNRLNCRALGNKGQQVHLRGFGALAPYALYAGFRHIDRLRFSLPFLFPPIPRVVVMMQKGREEEAEALDEVCAPMMGSPAAPRELR